MSVEDELRRDLVVAMKAGEGLRVSALRMVLSELQRAAKEGSADEVSVLRRERKRRLDAERTYREAQRPELADAELAEAELIDGYLPAELGDEELSRIVLAAVAQAGAQSIGDLGRVMPLALAEVAGRAGGRRVAARVREALAR